VTVSGEGAGGGRRLGSREKALVILLVIVAALAGVFLLLVNRGGDEDGALAPTRTPTATATATPAPTAEPTAEPTPDDGVPPLTSDGFEGRDPFQPLLVVDGDGDGGPGPTPTPTGTARPTDGDGETKTVALLDIFTADGERMATVEVDGQEFTVVEGDVFADNFRVIELTKRCGTFVFGDERFTLCIGQEVRK